MKITITRKTGFFGMASPLVITKDGKKVTSIMLDDTKEIEISEKQCELQVKFFLLKSQPLILSQNFYPKDYHFTIKMNPKAILIYLFLFLCFLLVGISPQKILMACLSLILFIAYFVYFTKRFYLLVEEEEE